LPTARPRAVGEGSLCRQPIPAVGTVGEQTLSAKDIFADSVVVGKEILSAKNWLGKRWTDAVNFADSTSLCCRQRYLFADSLAMLSAKSLHFF
jgi:hypothetical protein